MPNGYIRYQFKERQHTLNKKSITRYRPQYLDNLSVGCLVSPRKMLYLTPIWDSDGLHDWPEWKSCEVGIVLESVPKQIGVRILMSCGSLGICFADEILVHWDPSKDE